MRGKGKDLIDVVCERWGSARRRVLGITETLKSSEMLGSPRCTLGEKKIISSKGPTVQRFPEVYTGDDLVVNRAYRSMPPDLAQVFEVHYVAFGNQREKAAALRLPDYEYSERKRTAKRVVESFFNDAKKDVDF